MAFAGCRRHVRRWWVALLQASWCSTCRKRGGMKACGTRKNAGCMREGGMRGELRSPAKPALQNIGVEAEVEAGPTG